MKRSRWLPHPLMALVLTLMWLLLVNTLSVAHVLLGAFLGWGISLLCRDFLTDLPPLRRPFLLCRYLMMVLWDIVLANLSVARLVLGPQRRIQPSFVEVPMSIENEYVLSILACVISLTPGTVSAGLSADHKTLLLHGLDVDDRDALIAQVKSRYEAPLMEIFQCSLT